MKFLIWMAVMTALCIVDVRPVNAQGLQLFVAKRVRCHPYCQTVRCAPSTVADCTAGQALIHGDGDCYCCDSCVSVRRAEPPECPNCATSPCVSTETPNSCLEKDKAYVPADGKCQCCDACVRITTIPSH